MSKPPMPLNRLPCLSMAFLFLIFRVVGPRPEEKASCELFPFHGAAAVPKGARLRGKLVFVGTHGIAGLYVQKHNLQPKKGNMVLAPSGRVRASGCRTV